MPLSHILSKAPARLPGPVQLFHAALRATRPAALLHKIQQQQRLPLGHIHLASFYSTPSPPSGNSSDVSLQYRYGRLVLEVPLPSRSEKCRFFLQPMLMSVGDLVADLQREDNGVTASVQSKDGLRVASSSLIDTLLESDFQLIINDAVYDVRAPDKACVSSKQALGLEDVKHVVHLLHTALHLPDHHLLQERDLLERLDRLKQELSPLERTRAQLSRRAEFQASRTLWGGMALLSVQGGALAWLTWWVYSWDVMEPVTYFITYATSIGAFAYYVLTKQDYVYPEAKDRQFLHYFYKGAQKKQFNVGKYNQLREQLAEVEDDLKRLRNPTQLRLPLEQIQPKA